MARPRRARPVPAKAPSAAATAPAFAAPSTQAPVPKTQARKVVDVGPSDELPAVPPPLPPGTPGPVVTASGGETTADVPLSGSTSGMGRRGLTLPRGLPLN